MAVFGKTGGKPATAEEKLSSASDRSISAAPSPGSPASASPGAQAPSFRYVDRPELPETFADSITGLFFDGQSLRIEFAVSRVDELKPNTPVSGRRYPACRLVLPPGAAVELINKMQQIGAALTKAGVVRQSEPPKV